MIKSTFNNSILGKKGRLKSLEMEVYCIQILHPLFGILSEVSGINGYPLPFSSFMASAHVI